MVPALASVPDMPATTLPLTTSRLCAEAAVTRGQLRLYERQGLLPAPRRSAAGYRHYAPDAVERLAAIRQLKEIGFTLAEIALLLADHAAGGLDEDGLRELAREQVARIDARIARLEFVRRYLAPVAGGDYSALHDPDCRFLLRFLAAAPGAAARRRA